MRTSQPSSYDVFRATSFFPSLDGLRAIAVILVYCVHFGGDLGAAIYGRFGVQVFFVLSGFLITTLLLRENDETGKIDFRRFYLRRSFRILPVYWVVLALTAWQASHAPGPWDSMKRALPLFLTFFNETAGLDAPWRITWSLGIEWKFYLVWPLLAFAIARTNKARLAIAVLIVIALTPVWLNLTFEPRQYFYLMLGVFIAIAMNSRRGFYLIAPLMKPTVASVIFVAFVIFQLFSGKIMASLFLPKAEFVYSLAVVPLVMAILGGGFPNRLLSTRPMVFIGRRSYSMYLIQPFAVQCVAGVSPWRAEDIFNVFQVALLGLIFADVLYRCVEKPMIAYGNRLASRFHSPSAAPVHGVPSVSPVAGNSNR